VKAVTVNIGKSLGFLTFMIVFIVYHLSFLMNHLKNSSAFSISCDIQGLICDLQYSDLMMINGMKCL
jgi:hypothetical protein